MKKFKYRAQSYLKYLTFTRENALKELKVAENYRDNLLKKYASMEAQMRQCYEKVSLIGKPGCNVLQANDHNQFIEMLKIHMRNLSVEIQEAEQEYKIKLDALLELQLQVKKMELHKESELEKYKKEYRKKAQKLTDEINSTRKRGQNAESV